MGNETSMVSTGTLGQETDESRALQKSADQAHLEWTRLDAEAPPTARETVGVVSEADDTGKGDRLTICAGRANLDEFADVHHISLSAGDRRWVRREPAGRPPRSRSGHTAVHVPGKGTVLFGGLSSDKGFLSDCSLLTDDGWEPVCAMGELACGRDKHSAVLVPTSAMDADGAAGWRMIVFGGFGIMPPPEEEDDEDDDGDDKPSAAAEEADPRGRALELGWFDDAYAIDCETFYSARLRSSQPKEARPEARAAHAACWLANEAGGQMMVFGGRSATGRLNDTWFLDVRSGLWSAVATSGRTPSARSFHSLTAVVTPAGHPLAMLFGGLGADGAHLADMHVFCPTLRSWAFITASAPPRPRGCAAVAAGSEKKLLVFGGSAGWDPERGATEFYDELHEVSLLPLLERIDAMARPAAAAAAESAVEASHGSTTATSMLSSEADAPPAKKLRLPLVETTLGLPPPAASAE